MHKLIPMQYEISIIHIKMFRYYKVCIFHIFNNPHTPIHINYFYVTWCV